MAVIEDFRHAPVEHPTSVQSLSSLHGAFTCMTKVLEDYSTAVSATDNIHHADALACSLREMELAERSPKEAKAVLRRRYDQRSSSYYPLRCFPILRWTVIKLRVETLVSCVLLHLQAVHSLTKGHLTSESLKETTSTKVEVCAWP